MYNFSCFHTGFKEILRAHCVLNFYLQPFVCGLGFILNIACALIFWSASKNSRQGAGGQRLCMRPYLIALSVLDAVQLGLSFFVIILPQITNFLVKTQTGDPERILDLQNFGAFSIVILYPLLTSANYASIWTITVISIQRYFAVCYPLASRHRFHILRRSKSIIGTILFVALLLNAIRFGEFVLEPPTAEHPVFLPNATALRLSQTYNVISNGIIYPCLLYLIPLIVLAVLNYRIVHAIRSKESRLLEPRLSSISISSHREKQWEHRSAFMVLTIVLLFFACYTLSVITRWWELSRPEDFEVLRFGHHKTEVVDAVANLLVNLNSALNPFIYFFFTKMFRQFYVDIRSKRRRESRQLKNSLRLKISV